ncbi:MAG: apolipoprotein N-acyltransferase, partial [Sphingomonadales bacterium]|nr:apolipoprotein N-acyltransferase [Sphingomonadales bacterium]
LVATRMRAVEEGLPIVRSAGTGISAVIDAYGRVVTSIPLNTRGYVDASLPAALSLTPYARWGDSLFAALIVILLAKILILPSILRRRAD